MNNNKYLVIQFEDFALKKTEDGEFKIVSK